MNDFKTEKLDVVNFINKQILCHSVDVINKIMWGKYYADICPATLIIHGNVATPKNCTITRQQTMFLPDRVQMLGRTRAVKSAHTDINLHVHMLARWWYDVTWYGCCRWVWSSADDGWITRVLWWAIDVQRWSWQRKIHASRRGRQVTTTL